MQLGDGSRQPAAVRQAGSEDRAARLATRAAIIRPGSSGDLRPSPRPPQNLRPLRGRLPESNTGLFPATPQAARRQRRRAAARPPLPKS